MRSSAINFRLIISKTLYLSLLFLSMGYAGLAQKIVSKIDRIKTEPEVEKLVHSFESNFQKLSLQLYSEIVCDNCPTGYCKKNSRFFKNIKYILQIGF